MFFLLDIHFLEIVNSVQSKRKVKMTKSEIVSQIVKKTKLEPIVVSTIVESFFTEVKNALISNDEIMIREFGVFRNKKRKARPVQNIKAKKTIIMPEHYVPSFEASKKFYN